MVVVVGQVRAVEVLQRIERVVVLVLVLLVLLLVVDLVDLVVLVPLKLELLGILVLVMLVVLVLELVLVMLVMLVAEAGVVGGGVGYVFFRDLEMVLAVTFPPVLVKRGGGGRGGLVVDLRDCLLVDGCNALLVAVGRGEDT